MFSFFKKLGRNSKKNGFTLMELLVYTAILAIIVSTIGSFFLWTIRANNKAKTMREVLNNSERAINVITSEIKEAEDIYIPTSVFDSHPGQLSLLTTKYLPAGETLTYIDFYICDNRLCLKKESEDPIPLTSERVEVSNLVFSQVYTATSAPSLQIDFKIDYKNPNDRPEYRTSFETSAVASLRNY